MRGTSNIHIYEESLENFPDHPELSAFRILQIKPDWDRDENFREGKVNFVEYMEKFKKLQEDFRLILKKLPRGHYFIPEIYYAIGKLWIDWYENVERERKEVLEGTQEMILRKKVRHYYDLGVKAERDLLPGYFPYFRLDKEIIEEFLEPSLDPKIFPKVKQEKFWFAELTSKLPNFEHSRSQV